MLFRVKFESIMGDFFAQPLASIPSDLVFLR